MSGTAGWLHAGTATRSLRLYGDTCGLSRLTKRDFGGVIGALMDLCRKPGRSIGTPGIVAGIQHASPCRAAILNLLSLGVALHRPE